MTPLPNLENDIAKLQTALSSLEFWMTAATTLVVIGLILEYWHEVPESINDIRKGWSWKPFLTLLGAVLITVGVAGELLDQFLASRKEGQLERDNNALYATLRDKATSSEKEAAQLRQDAEKEKSARLEIEDSITWRKLTPTQEADSAKLLRGFSGINTPVFFHAGDYEGSAFAYDIFSMLRQAHWNTFSPASVLDLAETGHREIVQTPIEMGVMVSRTSDQRSLRAAKGLVTILNSIGFDARVESQIDKRSIASVIVTVGARPQGPQGAAKLRHQKSAPSLSKANGSKPQG